MSRTGHQTLATYQKSQCQAGPYRATISATLGSFVDKEGFFSFRDQNGLSFNNFNGVITPAVPFPVCTWEGIITQKNEGGKDNSLTQISDPKRKTGLSREGTLLVENVTSITAKGGNDIWIIPPHYFRVRAEYDQLLNAFFVGKFYYPALPVPIDPSRPDILLERLGLDRNDHPLYASLGPAGAAGFAEKKHLLSAMLINSIPKFRAVYTTPPRALLSLQSI